MARYQVNESVRRWKHTDDRNNKQNYNKRKINSVFGYFIIGI